MIPKCLKWWTFLTWPQNWQLFFNYPVSAVSSIFGTFVGLIRSLSNPTKRWHFFIFRTEIFQWPLWAQLLIRIAFSGFFYELKLFYTQFWQKDGHSGSKTYFSSKNRKWRFWFKLKEDPPILRSYSKIGIF